MRYVTLFLKTENVHLLKDVGMIPYYLYKEHGMDCTIATYNNSGDYTYLDKEVKGLKLDYVRKTKGGRIIDGIWYLIKNAKDIDILNVYHLNLSAFFYELVYKMLNPKGIIYLKLDMNPVGLINCFRKDPRGLIKRTTITMSDIASVETTKMLKRLRKYYGNKVIYVPNGCYKSELNDNNNGSYDKKNIILTVGNLGTYEKATDVLLEAYAEYIKKNTESDYRLRLVGTIDESFKSYIDEYFKKNPQLKDRITFTGPIIDKVLLNEEYKRARIFTLPSLSESFGIVLVEAARMGCYLITSDMVPAGYDISDEHKYGDSVKAGDVSALADCFSKVCSQDIDWNRLAIETAAHVEAAYNWSTIIDKLNVVLINRTNTKDK